MIVEDVFRAIDTLIWKKLESYIDSRMYHHLLSLEQHESSSIEKKFSISWEILGPCSICVKLHFLSEIDSGKQQGFNLQLFAPLLGSLKMDETDVSVENDGGDTIQTTITYKTAH